MKSRLLFRKSRNGGYARGNNFGARKAISDGCDSILISNNDMIILRKFNRKNVLDT